MRSSSRLTCPFGNTGALWARLAVGLNGPNISLAGGFPAATRRKALTPQHGVAANRKAALKLVTDDDQSLIAEGHAEGETEDGGRAGAAPARLEGLSPEERSREILNLILTELDDDKAEDVVTIPLAGKSEIADAMVIASGRSQRHVGAIADKIIRHLKEAGFGTARAEGMPACDWVLIDAQDVIVHLFRPEVRAFYNLERIWSEAARAPAQTDA